MKINDIKPTIIQHLKTFKKFLLVTENYQINDVNRLIEKLECNDVVISGKHPIEDYNIINRLDVLVSQKHCRIVFNHDDQDGYFCQISPAYSTFKYDVLADLKLETKRETLLEAMIAAVEFLESK